MESEVQKAKQNPELFFPPQTSKPRLNEATGLDEVINNDLWSDALNGKNQTERVFHSTIYFPGSVDSEIGVVFTPNPLSVEN